MRKINEYEIFIARKLYSCIGINVGIDCNQKVWVVNHEMGSIRADYCPINCPLYSIAVCETKDNDGIPVVVTLLINKDKKFGELDFWKVNDEPIFDFTYVKNHINNISKI
ncbi:hypothetical protein LV564_07215 [Komagataeibacter nataicola]|uniref:DUF6984 family protein n=1 Tax=Komagataeibacter nataicola TaxID=265960 RepID=UPI0011B6A3D9|nr:hypothetical protein [Komagataeibacter nataicola]WEQ56850.1 hypothetical protein LV564_07215 [Komagataeibacter nataicola]WNM08313.1 hypothetical protein RI056_15790 [Komagataeibacter nataicola]